MYIVQRKYVYMHVCTYVQYVHMYIHTYAVQCTCTYTALHTKYYVLMYIVYIYTIEHVQYN